MKRTVVDLVSLPASCEFCAAMGGLWRRGARGGVERCGCPRGRILAAADDARRVSRHRTACRPVVAVHDGKLLACGER